MDHRTGTREMKWRSNDEDSAENWSTDAGRLTPWCWFAGTLFRGTARIETALQPVGRGILGGSRDSFHGPESPAAAAGSSMTTRSTSWPLRSPVSGSFGGWMFTARSAIPLRACDHGRAALACIPSERPGLHSRHRPRAIHDDDMLRDALMENLHRQQLDPLEEAAAYRRLLDDFGATTSDSRRRSAGPGRTSPTPSGC